MGLGPFVGLPDFGVDVGDFDGNCDGLADSRGFADGSRDGKGAMIDADGVKVPLHVPTASQPSEGGSMPKVPQEKLMH